MHSIHQCGHRASGSTHAHRNPAHHQMIFSDRNRQIARIVALLLAILSTGSAAAHASGSSQQRTPEYGGAPQINASEAPAALTKAYPLRTGPPAAGPRSARPHSASPRSANPLRKTRPAPSRTLAPSSNGNLFWLFWLALGGGLALVLFLFWLEVGGRQTLRLSQRPKATTDQAAAIALAPRPPATGRARIVGSRQLPPYAPRFGTQVRGITPGVGRERGASDDRQDREADPPRRTA